MAEFDGEALISQFNTQRDEHDIDGIAGMFTEDVVFEASFGRQPCGERAVGRKAGRKPAAAIFERIPNLRFKEIRHFVSPEFAVVESVTTGTLSGGALPTNGSH